MISSKCDYACYGDINRQTTVMFRDRERRENVDELADDYIIRAAVEARRVQNAIPDHLLPSYQPFHTFPSDSRSPAQRLLATMYDTPMWLWKASLETVKSIANAVWRTDTEIEQKVGYHC